MAITGAQSHDHFQATEFDSEIESHGTNALWRKASACPCRDRRTGVAEFECPFCDNGVLWDAGSEIQVLAPGRQRKDEYDVAGMSLQGLVYLTFRSGIRPGHLDRVDFLSAEMVITNEILERGATNKQGASLERLRFGSSAIAVERCSAIEGTPAALVEYVQGVDFTLGSDGSITWGIGDTPSDGVQYGLRYRARPSFVIWSPSSRDEATNKMPYRSLAQRLDFFAQRAVGE